MILLCSYSQIQVNNYLVNFDPTAWRSYGDCIEQVSHCRFCLSVHKLVVYQHAVEVACVHKLVVYQHAVEVACEPLPHVSGLIELAFPVHNL